MNLYQVMIFCVFFLSFGETYVHTIKQNNNEKKSIFRQYLLLEELHWY